MENNALISDQKEVCSVLNEFYVNIAKKTGINSQTVDGRNHPSILAIQENSPEEGYHLLILSQLTKNWSWRL